MVGKPLWRTMLTTEGPHGSAVLFFTTHLIAECTVLKLNVLIPRGPDPSRCSAGGQ